MGGLGIGSLKTFNIALLLKWWWRLKCNSKAIWCNIINQIHKCNGKSWDRLALKSIKGIWNDIAKMKLDLENLGIKIGDIFKQEVKRGDKTSFWQDIWIDNEPLKIIFPNLYNLESSKFVQVSNRCGSNAVSWAWKRKPKPGTEVADLAALEAKLSNFQPMDQEDKPTFLLGNEGAFSVGLLRAHLDSSIMGTKFGGFQWSKVAPLKVDCFVWKASLDRISTKIALQARGISISSTSCVLCGDHLESSQHLFFECQFANELWHWTSKWCDIDFANVKNLGELISFINSHSNRKKQKSILLALTYGLIWIIWKAGNDKVFKKKCWSVGMIMDNFILETFSWVKHRGKMVNLKWEEWCINPLNAIM